MQVFTSFLFSALLECRTSCSFFVSHSMNSMYNPGSVDIFVESKLVRLIKSSSENYSGRMLTIRIKLPTIYNESLFLICCHF